MNSWDKYDLDSFAKIYFRDIIHIDEVGLRELFQESYKDLESKIDIFENTTKLTKKHGWQDMEYIWNIGGFILNTSLDLKISGEGLVFSNGYRKKEYYIKNSCILIYEFLEDIEQLLGKKFNDILDKYVISSDFIVELRQKKKNLSHIRREHHKSLKAIRSIIGAHRDHNFLLQLETMNNLKDVAFLQLIMIFDEALNELANPIGKILTESVDKFVLLRKL